MSNLFNLFCYVERGGPLIFEKAFDFFFFHRSLEFCLTARRPWKWIQEAAGNPSMVEKKKICGWIKVSQLLPPWMIEAPREIFDWLMEIRFCLLPAGSEIIKILLNGLRSFQQKYKKIMILIIKQYCSVCWGWMLLEKKGVWLYSSNSKSLTSNKQFFYRKYINLSKSAYTGKKTNRLI